jgi:hypothetical protein
VRPFTKLTLLVLFLLLLAAAIAQFTMTPPERPYPGPVPGTPYPISPASP